MRTLVVGCGNAIEKGFGGPVRYVGEEYSGVGWYSHALHTHPTNCTTVDKDPRCEPSVVLDFTTDDHREVIHKLGHEKFNLIVLENLSYNAYSDIHLIRNCHSILSETGQIFIPQVDIENGEDLPIKMAFSSMSFRLIHESNDFLRIYPIISAFTGKYADQFIMKYRTFSLKLDWDLKYLVFKH